MVTFIDSFINEDIVHEIHACIGCLECLVACPTLAVPIAINTLNYQTLSGPISPQVAQFARACTQCGACVNVCPIGLHRDAMMLWLKLKLLCSQKERVLAHKRRLPWSKAADQAHHFF